jgi:hypothetical protein
MTQDLDAALRQLSSTPSYPGLASIAGAVLDRVPRVPPNIRAHRLGIGTIATVGALMLGIATGRPAESARKLTLTLH